jgi:hypothetical protein
VKAEERAREAAKWVDKEIERLVVEMETLAEGVDSETQKPWCTFGTLFLHYQVR